MVIKTTIYDYSCLVVHHPDLGFLFIGRIQDNTNPAGSRYIYPAMQINTGDCYELSPSELIGSLICDDMFIRFKKERLPR